MQQIAVVFLQLCLWLFMAGLTLWVGYWLIVALMAVFPFVAAVTLGAFVAMAFIAWRRAHG